MSLLLFIERVLYLARIHHIGIVCRMCVVRGRVSGQIDTIQFIFYSCTCLYFDPAELLILRKMGLIDFGLVWFGLVWFGLVWFGLVWFGLVWFGLHVMYDISCYVQTLQQVHVICYLRHIRLCTRTLHVMHDLSCYVILSILFVWFGLV
jgi:hypothetical protein